MQSLALVSALPQTCRVCLALQPAMGRLHAAWPGAAGSLGIAVLCPLPSSVHPHFACKPTTVLWVTCPSGSLPNVPGGAEQSGLHPGQPQWDAMGSTSQGCRAGSTQSLPRESRAEEASRAPKCTGWLQMAFAEPAASRSQPRRMHCVGRLPTAPGVWKAPKQPVPRETPRHGHVP